MALKRFVESSFLVLGSNVLAKTLSFLTISIIARILSTQEVGIYNGLLTVALSINQMADLGFGIILQRESARVNVSGSKKLGNIYGVAILFTLILNGIIFLAITFFDDYFFHLLIGTEAKISIQFFRLIPYIIFFQYLNQLPSYLIMGVGEFREYAKRTIASNFFSILLIPIACYYGGVAFALQSFAAVLMLTSIFSWRIAIKILKEKNIELSLESFFPELKNLLVGGFFYYLGNTLVGALFSIMTVNLVATYVGVSELGYLRLASSLAVIVGIIPAALAPVLLSFTAAGDTSENVRLKSLTIRFVTAFVFFITVAVIILSKIIIPILFGSKYLDGIVLFNVSIALNFLIIITSLFNNFLTAKGYLSYIGVLAVVFALVNIALSYFLIPSMGINGYFIAGFTTYVLSLLGGAGKEFWTTEYGSDTYLLTNLLGILIGVSIVFLGLSYILSFYLIFAIFIIVFPSLFFKLALNDSEKLQLNSYLATIKTKIQHQFNGV